MRRPGLMARKSRPSAIGARCVVALGLAVAFCLPLTVPGGLIGMPDAQAGNPGKTPPAKGKPTPVPTPKPTQRPTPRPTPKPTAQPTAQPTPRATPRPTAKPTQKPAAQATPKPTAKPTPRPAGGATAKPQPGASQPQATDPSGTGSTQPSGSPEPELAVAVASGGSLLGPVLIGGVGLFGGGGILFGLARRRRSPADEPENVEPRRHVPAPGAFADPLLEAMAVTARASGPRTESRAAPGADGRRAAAWVRRLDAEINVMADLKAAPTPPPHVRDGALDPTGRPN